jgi:YD repeat-containing protein
VFALFYEHPDGQLKFIADAANSRVAIYLGKTCSLEKQLPVIGFENRDGTTRECCRFEHGELIGVFSTDGDARHAS